MPVPHPLCPSRPLSMLQPLTLTQTLDCPWGLRPFPSPRPVISDTLPEDTPILPPVLPRPARESLHPSNPAPDHRSSLGKAHDQAHRSVVTGYGFQHHPGLSRPWKPLDFPSGPLCPLPEAGISPATAHCRRPVFHSQPLLCSPQAPFPPTPQETRPRDLSQRAPFCPGGRASRLLPRQSPAHLAPGPMSPAGSPLFPPPKASNLPVLAEQTL